MIHRSTIGVLLSSLAIACSSSPSPAPGGSSSTNQAPPAGSVISPTPAASSNTTPAPSATTPGSTTPGATGSTCAASATSEACYECCDAQSGAGAQKYGEFLAAADACVCQQCATQCATTACAATPTEPPAGSACETCLNATTTCWDKLEADCNADASCKLVNACYSASGCEDKP